MIKIEHTIATIILDALAWLPLCIEEDLLDKYALSEFTANLYQVAGMALISEEDSSDVSRSYPIQTVYTTLHAHNALSEDKP